MQKLLSFLKGKWFSSQTEPPPVVDLDYQPNANDVHSYCMELVLYYQGMAPHELQLFDIRSFPFVGETFADFLSTISNAIRLARKVEYQAPLAFPISEKSPARYFIDERDRYLDPGEMLEKYVLAVQEFLSLALTEGEHKSFFITYRINTASFAFALVKLTKALIAAEKSAEQI